MLRTTVLSLSRAYVPTASSRAVVGHVPRRFFSQTTIPTGAEQVQREQPQPQTEPTETAPSTEALDLARRILTSPEFFDQPQLNQKAKREAIETFRRHPVDTGSSEVQVAVLSERIMRLQQHFEKNKKDIHSRRGLMELMQRRRKLLLYMASQDPEAYVKVIEKYQIREGKGSSRVSDRPEEWSPPRRKEDVTYRPKTWLEFKAASGKDTKRKA